MNNQLALFDYGQLDTETRIVVQQRTNEIKALMKRTAQDIIEIGEKLIEVKERLGHGGFGAWLEAEFEWSEPTAQRFMRVANHFKSVKLTDLSMAPSALYLLAAPSTPETLRQEMIDRARNGEAVTYSAVREAVATHKQSGPMAYENGSYIVTVEPKQATAKFSCTTCGDIFETQVWHCSGCNHHWPMTQSHCKNCHQGETQDVHLDAALADEGKPVCQECGQVYDGPKCPDCNKPSNVHFSSESNEWYTPEHILGRVIQVMGEIDLDPCSNPGPPNVPAKKHHTQEDDGLSKSWYGRVYMNPPYGREIKDWVNYLVSQWTAGYITEAIALVPARTDTEWFRTLEPFPRCFIYGRLIFSGYDNSAPFPSMVVYLGDRVELFKEAFRDIGGIYRLDN